MKHTIIKLDIDGKHSKLAHCQMKRKILLTSKGKLFLRHFSHNSGHYHNYDDYYGRHVEH